MSVVGTQAEQTLEQAPGGIDLDVVREMLSHFQPQDFQEAQELILSALQESK